MLSEKDLELSKEFMELNIPDFFKNNIRELIDVIHNYFEKCEIYLFGSCAKRSLKMSSDIDLFVLLDKPIAKSEKLHLVYLLDCVASDWNRDYDLLIYSKSKFDSLLQSGSYFESKIYKECIRII
jgi:predicted nucleotidyltransferase